jgi:phosphatidylinositol alpha-1,6-mannosyltransferase
VTVLLLTEVFPPKTGGSGRWMWELYRRLDKIDVQVAAGNTAGAESFDRTHALRIQRLPLAFTNWGVFDLRGGPQYAAALARLFPLVRRTKPDVIHAGKFLPEGLLALIAGKLTGVPFECYAHGEELTLGRTTGELRWLGSKVLRQARRIIANSQHTQQLLTVDWGVPPEKIVVMHPGVDTACFTPAPPSSAVRERLGWAGRRVVLTVGTLQKRKGQDMLIRALPEIRRQCPDVLYSIAGEGREREYLDRLVKEHHVGDIVQFRGVPKDDELIDCYQQCDLFALPNRQVGWDLEGFGIVFLEAQACRRPVIAGKSGGAPETLQPSVTGEVVECETPDNLARVVVALLNDPERRARMGTAGRRWVEERFSWDVLSRQAEELFAR